MEVVIYNQDIISIVLQFLGWKGKDVIYFKLANSHLNSIAQQVIPIHHFIHILQCIQRNKDSPTLLLPNSFVLEKDMADRISLIDDEVLGKPFTETDILILDITARIYLQNLSLDMFSICFVFR